MTGVVDGDTLHVLRNDRDVTLGLIGVDTLEVDWYGGEPSATGAPAARFARRKEPGLWSSCP